MIYNLNSRNQSMAGECNIDARGKFFRLVGGTASLIVASVMLLMLIFEILPTNWFTISSVIGAFAGGILGIYEGRSGWCVARAMGIWTPI